jgi:dihydroorotase
MQKTLSTPAPTFDLDLAHEHNASALDFIQNIKSNGFVLATFTPHFLILALISGALFLYS